MMKLNSVLSSALVVLAFLVGSNDAKAQGKSYRMYSGTLTVSGKAIGLGLKVDEEIIEQRFGDPEIPGHGFIRKSLSVKVYEGELSCTKNLLLENGEIQSCSGLTLLIQNPESILSEKEVEGKAYLSSNRNLDIGKFTLKLEYTQEGEHEGSIDQ